MSLALALALAIVPAAATVVRDAQGLARIGSAQAVAGAGAGSRRPIVAESCANARSRCLAGHPAGSPTSRRARRAQRSAGPPPVTVSFVVANTGLRAESAVARLVLAARAAGLGWAPSHG